MNENSNRVREIREEKGLDLRFVAKRAGTSAQMLSMIERGERRLSLQWMNKIAAALDCAPADLLPNGLTMPAAPTANHEAQSVVASFKGVPVLGNINTLTGRLNLKGSSRREPIAALDKIDGSSVVMMPDGSMSPRYHDGQKLLVNPDYPITPGSSVLLELADGCGLVRELVSKGADEWVVKTYKPLADEHIPIPNIKRAWLVIAAFEI